MKTTMTMKDLKKSNGFPTDIDKSKTVVVQVKKWISIVLYYSIDDGLPASDNIFYYLEKKYTPGIYIINPK